MQTGGAAAGDSDKVVPDLEITRCGEVRLGYSAFLPSHQPVPDQDFQCW